MSNIPTAVLEQPEFKRTDIATAVKSTVPVETKSLFEIPEQNWSEVENIYQAAGSGLIDIVNAIDQAVRKIKADTEHKPSVELTVAINGVNKDLTTFTEDLVFIHNLHKGKVGKITSDDEVQQSMKIVLDYNEFMERFRTSIITPLAVISEELLKIETPVLKTKENTINTTGV